MASAACIGNSLDSLPKTAAVPDTAPAAKAAATHERRNDGEAVLSARDRYLARKRQREAEPSEAEA